MGNVVLIGFMGCGKSSVAVKLSYRLKRQMTDTDRLIEKKQGKSIREIFEQDGEEAFRQMETQTLQELKETAKNQVISVGGGTPVREENRTLMKEIGKVVYLRAKAETLYERLKKDTNRPLLQGGDEDLKTKIQGLLEKRSSAYEEAADLIIDVDDKPFGQVLYEIERGIRPSYRDNANTASEEGGYKGKYSQRYPLGQRFGYGTRAPYGKPSYGTFGSYGQSAAGSRFLSGGRSSYDGHTEGDLQALANTCSTEEKAQSYGSQPYGKSSYGQQAEGGQLFYRQQFSRAAAEKEKKKSLRKLLVINGPNLNFLGIREKGIYGTQDYNDLLNMIAQKGLDCHAAISVFQSNHEGAIIDKIQEAYFDKTEGIIINPGAYTHYSYAIRDALASITVPKVEIHISNIMEREDFRKVSVTAPVCDKQIYGHGLNGYLEAIDFVLEKLDEQE